MSLFAEPYKYVLDSSALFDLKHRYPPNTFKGLWDKFENACTNAEIISVREVLNEVNKGNDWLVDWSKKYSSIFLMPTAEELNYLALLQDKYPKIIDPLSDKPNADPFIIASAKTRGLTIVQHERFDPNQHKIPTVARSEQLECIPLTKLFELEKWKF